MAEIKTQTLDSYLRLIEISRDLASTLDLDTLLDDMPKQLPFSFMTIRRGSSTFKLPPTLMNLRCADSWCRSKKASRVGSFPTENRSA